MKKALAHGLYGTWTPTDAELARLDAIFPDGVCDYSKGDAGEPNGLDRKSK